jgi:anthranilate phosphoribosyltransferase
MKGETVAEITGAARVMRARATPIRIGRQSVDIDREEINVDRETIVDTCGTGGSGTRSFNISTTVAFVVAACGIRVAKHGNRSISSACGSADVLEKLGVNLDVTPQMVEQCIERIGVGFLFVDVAADARARERRGQHDDGSSDAFPHPQRGYHGGDGSRCAPLPFV